MTVNCLQPNWEIIALGIYPLSTGPDFYVLVGMDDSRTEYLPLMIDGAIAAARSIQECQNMLRQVEPTVPAVLSLPEDYALLADVTQTIYLLLHENDDKNATILNFFNTFEDLIKPTEFFLPERKQEIVTKTLSHLTFSREYGVFFEACEISRNELIDCVLWLVGAVTCSLSIYPE